MSKQSKKERKAEREAARAAARKAERQRNIATLIVLGIVVALGGVLIAISLDDTDDELAELLEQLEQEREEEQEQEQALEERPIACDGTLPDRAGEPRPTYDEPRDVIDAGVDYQAVIETSCGTITIDLDAQRAPEGVNAFVFLATDGFYDGLEIFRHAVGIDVFQTGSGTDDAAFQIGYTLPDELDAAEEDGYPPGSVAYANAGPGTSGSQFFMIYGDAFQETVDTGGLQVIYTRFGTITDGLDVLERIAEIPVDGETPQELVYMETVRILADGEELPTAVPDSADEVEADDDAATTDDDEEEEE